MSGKNRKRMIQILPIVLRDMTRVLCGSRLLVEKQGPVTGQTVAKIVGAWPDPAL
jgi:hypothetical protein